MNKLVVFFLLLQPIHVVVEAQTVKKLATPPAALKYRGKPVGVWAWKDSLGENILLLSQLTNYTTVSRETGEEAGNADLFGYHYIRRDTGWRLVWKIADGVKDCPVDVAAAFFTAATTVTDIDKDGVCETTVLYKVACRGDVSPSAMKLIMHEGETKYALRGRMWVAVGEDSKFDLEADDLDLSRLAYYTGSDDEYLVTYGRYENENAFKGSPAFLSHAQKTWLQFVKESFD